MSESTTRQRIAAMWGGISGISTAFPTIPRALQDAQLPASVVFPGAASHNRNTDNASDNQTIEDIRIYKMVLYIENAAFGTEGELVVDADPYFDAVLNHFAARPGLELDSQFPNQAESVFDAVLLRDNGLQVGPYPLGAQGRPAHDYIQIQWDLQVTELINIVYED